MPRLSRLLVLGALMPASVAVIQPRGPEAPKYQQRVAGLARRAALFSMCTTMSVPAGPTEAQCAALASARPSPALQPREVIETTMCALHQKNLDSPYAFFGSEVAMRFLSLSSPASRSSLQRFADYLSQEWYLPLVDWSEMRWDGDLVLLKNGAEAYQQVQSESESS